MLTVRLRRDDLRGQSHKPKPHEAELCWAANASELLPQEVNEYQQMDVTYVFTDHTGCKR
jgi:hypothetical protein